MACGRFGRYANRTNLLSGHGRFLLAQAEAEAMFDSIANVVRAGWHTEMRAEFGADRLRCYGVYRGARRARWNDIEILPVMDFLRHLWDGDILD